MKNISKKFYLYLLNNKKRFLEKKDFEIVFDNFSKMWDLDISFSSAFQSLKQQKKIVFLFNKIWYVLDEEEWFKYKKKKLEKLDILIKYLNYLGIHWYFGLSTAKYFLGNWQSLTSVYIMNEKFDKKMKFDGLEVFLFKMPRRYFIDKSVLISGNKRFSDFEKTFLDEIHFYLKNKSYLPQFDSKNISFNTLNLYLKVYDDDIRTWLLNNLDKEFVRYIE